MEKKKYRVQGKAHVVLPEIDEKNRGIPAKRRDKNHPNKTSKEKIRLVLQVQFR